MLRTGHHKLIVQHGHPASDRPRTGELYDLRQDPDELVNLWNDPGTADLRIALERQLLDVLTATANRAKPRETFW
jgi:hypothetical protein